MCRCLIYRTSLAYVCASATKYVCPVSRDVSITDVHLCTWQDVLHQFGLWNSIVLGVAMPYCLGYVRGSTGNCPGYGHVSVVACSTLICWFLCPFAFSASILGTSV
eukprot:scpid106147/ scgid31824/ 